MYRGGKANLNHFALLTRSIPFRLIQIPCHLVLPIKCKMLAISTLLFLNVMRMVTTNHCSAITRMDIVGARIRMATPFLELLLEEKPTAQHPVHIS